MNKRILLLVPVALALAGAALVASAQQSGGTDRATAQGDQARQAAARADRSAADARREAARRAAEEARKAREAARESGARRPAEREEEEDGRR